jgi:hypothetical protein
VIEWLKLLIKLLGRPAFRRWLSPKSLVLLSIAVCLISAAWLMLKLPDKWTGNGPLICLSNCIVGHNIQAEQLGPNASRIRDNNKPAEHSRIPENPAATEPASNYDEIRERLGERRKVFDSPAQSDAEPKRAEDRKNQSPTSKKRTVNAKPSTGSKSVMRGPPKPAPKMPDRCLDSIATPCPLPGAPSYDHYQQPNRSYGIEKSMQDLNLPIPFIFKYNW